MGKTLFTFYHDALQDSTIRSKRWGGLRWLGTGSLKSVQKGITLVKLASVHLV